MINKQSLIDSFGADIPSTLLAGIDTINGYTDINRRDFHVMDVLDVNHFDGFNLRYNSTPLELFPFATNCSGGEHFGYIIHIEGAPDYQSGFLHPIDSYHVDFLGKDTKQTLQALLTEDIAVRKEHRRLIESLGLDLDTFINRFDNCTDNSSGNSSDLKPPIPNDWKWMNSSDHIGVLAPEELFNPLTISEKEYKRIYYNDIKKFMTLAKNDRAKGYYGTALYYLKELHFYYPDELCLTNIFEEMIEIYGLLKRPHLVKVAMNMIERLENDRNAYGI